MLHSSMRMLLLGFMSFLLLQFHHREDPSMLVFSSVFKQYERQIQLAGYATIYV